MRAERGWLGALRGLSGDGVGFRGIAYELSLQEEL
jgi:hypothetical protein